MVARGYQVPENNEVLVLKGEPGDPGEEGLQGKTRDISIYHPCTSISL